jgi:hypothetical protein
VASTRLNRFVLHVQMSAQPMRVQGVRPGSVMTVKQQAKSECGEWLAWTREK